MRESMSIQSTDVKASTGSADRSMLPILSAVSIGFVLAIIVSIYSLAKLARENTKELDTMLTYRIYDSISSSLNEPIIVSETMACDEFLSDFLKNEDSMSEDEAIAAMQNYLSGIKGGLKYDSAFLVSESTHRYYTYEGLNKIVDPANDEHDIWYSIFVDKNKPYDLDVDSDEVNAGVWTVFVNARIEDEEGNLLGVCGVGVQMTNLQQLFLESEKEYNVKINLVDSNGLVQVDTEDINIENAWLDTDVLGGEEDEYSYQMTGNNEFAVTKYVEYLGWYLVVRSSTTSISREFFNIILLNIVLFLLVMGVLIVMIARIMARSKKERDAREKLLIVSERAVAASEAKSSFLSSMSHEIRTPINAVLGMNEMILRESDDKKILEYSSNIKSAGRTLLTLINSILDFSKIEEGKMEIIPVDYETASLVGNIIMSVEERAEAKGLEFITEIDENLPSRMNGDDVRILQIVMNLLSNAVKYTDKGHVKLTVKEQERDGDDTDVFFCVEDTGIGIRKEDLPRLFESFERLDEVKNHGIEGTGLGMSIVTNLLKMMGSEIRVDSDYGKGSSFYFVIRQKVVDAAPMGDYSKAFGVIEKCHNERLHAPGVDVLVVDDNGMNLKVADNLLKLFGINAQLAVSGEEALKCVKTKKYQLILLDHMMPHMDGVETLKKMREDHLLYNETKVIALTANAINGAREEYLAAGFDDYLSKPIEVSALEELLRKWLPESEISNDDGIKYSDDGEIMEFAPAGESSDAAESGEFVDWLAKAGFDTKSAMTYCGGDASFYRELLDDYITYRDEKLAELDKDFEAENWKDYCTRIHALKSVSRTIGAIGIGDRAFELEKASKEGDADFVRSNYPDFKKAYVAVTELIRKAIY